MSLKITVLDTKKTEKEAFSVLTDFQVRQQLLAQVIKSELANLRGGNAHTKIRSEVRGGGKKPWKQKGTGRARHGSIRSPLWVGGGVTFGPRNTVNHHQKINKSARFCALKSILKDRLDEGLVFELSPKFKFEKTKEAVTFIEKFKLVDKTKKLTIVYLQEDKPKLMGLNNLKVNFVDAANLKFYKLAKNPTIILTPKALELLEAKLAN